MIEPIPFLVGLWAGFSIGVFLMFTNKGEQIKTILLMKLDEYLPKKKEKNEYDGNPPDSFIFWLNNNENARKLLFITTVFFYLIILFFLYIIFV